MERSHYIATMHGDGIVALPPCVRGRPVADVLPIALAEQVLADHRAAAWTYGEEGLRTHAKTLLEYANELTDALDDAAVQRAKFSAAAAELERAAA